MKLAALKLALIGVLAVGAVAPAAEAAPHAAVSGATQLERAEASYLKGDYDRALKAARTLEASGRAPAALRPRLYLLLARLAAVYEDEANVRRWLKALYAVEPQTQLDVYNDPPMLFNTWQAMIAAAPKPPPPSGSPSPAASAAPPPPSAAGTASAAKAKPAVNPRAHSIGWVSYLPFGIGHFDEDQYQTGLAFLALDLGAVYGSIAMAGTAQGGDQTPRLLVGPAAVFGLYGYELLDLLPTLSGRNAESGESLRDALPFFPLGVGQAANGEIGKAIGFGVVQAGFLAEAVTTDDDGLRRLSTAGFVAAYAYGCYDAWSKEPPAGAKSGHVQVLPLPTFSAHGAPGLALELTATL